MGLAEPKAPVDHPCRAFVVASVLGRENFIATSLSQASCSQDVGINQVQPLYGILPYTAPQSTRLLRRVRLGTAADEHDGEHHRQLHERIFLSRDSYFNSQALNSDLHTRTATYDFKSTKAGYAEDLV